MTSIEIDCAGEKLRLLPEKAVHWPAADTLIVADLHFGKPAAFRASGIGVPEATTATDLERLTKLLHETKASRLVICGDFTHAAKGMQAVMMGALEKWRGEHSPIEMILVAGNHDRRCDPLPQHWNIVDAGLSWNCKPFVFTHAPGKSKSGYVIAGHLHPAIVLWEKFGPSVRAPAFWFGEREAVLPAFGSFTGMSPIRPERGDRVFAVGNGEIIQVCPGRRNS